VAVLEPRVTQDLHCATSLLYIFYSVILVCTGVLKPLVCVVRGEHWEQRLGVKLARGGASLAPARRGRVGAGKRGGVLGAEGVARVVSDRLPAMRQPLRAG
jgi:hypothetical protein